MRTLPALALMATLAVTVVHAQVSAPDGAAPRTAVERAIPLLQESAVTWTTRGKCASCHHQGLGAAAIAVARERGFRVDETKLAHQIASIRSQLAPPDISITVGPNLDHLDGSLWLLALGAVGAERDSATAREVYRLFGGQHVAGHWTPFPQRPPLEGSFVAQTAYTIRALRLFTPAGREREADARIKRAVAWIERQTPIDTQDLATQILGLAWSGVAAGRLERQVAQLLALQRQDGGWGQIASRPSDAYATGQAIVALTQGGGVSTKAPAIQKAIAFLVSAQQSDGSWLVETRRTWKRGLPYFESGFPHGKHQFISYAGAAWATMALALAGSPERSAALMGPVRAGAAAAEEASDGLTPLMRAALYGSADDVRAALKTVSDVNAATSAGMTALMCAAHDPAKVAMLIEAGANVRAATGAGHTALLIAADYDGAAESVRLLLAKGADPNARTTATTPLIRATMRGDRAVAGMLLDAGATVNERPEVSRALTAAVHHTDLELVSLLLDRGAPIESNPSGVRVVNGEQQPTPLMLAADRSAVALVKLLLQRGANIDARDRDGMTPLMYAVGGIDIGPASTEVVQVLLAAKPDLTARSRSGETALEFATRLQRTEIAALLKNAAAH